MEKIMGANGIGDRSTQTKQQSQVAKLTIAQAKREGRVVAVDGTVTGGIDATKPYFRAKNVYDLTQLPDTYNANEPGPDDNPNTGGLITGRPWTMGGVLPTPATPTVNIDSTFEIDGSITGTYDSSNSTSFTVTIDSVTYTLGTSPELTAVGDNWTLDLSAGVQTLDYETTYSVVATSNGTVTDTSSNEITTVSEIANIVADADTSLQIWYDGSDITQFQPTNPSDGDGITQWNDKSNFAHNANPIGTGPAARATYETNGLNTYSVVRFDGDAGLSINPFASLANTNAQTVFVVAKATNLGGGTQHLTSTNNGGLSIFHDGAVWKTNTSGGTGATSNAGDSNWHIFTLLYNGNGATDVDKLKLRIDKNQELLDFTADPGVGSTLLGTTKQYNFACRADGVDHFIGDIAEVLMFNKVLSAQELADVEEYLNTHWALGL